MIEPAIVGCCAGMAASKQDKPKRCRGKRDTGRSREPSGKSGGSRSGIEGRIDDGYGEGTVVVWDIGPYDNLTEKDGEIVPAGRAIEDGHLKIVLHGEKLTGAFALTHTKLGGDDANWMLVTVDDEGADRRRSPTSTQNESVLSGKINEDFEK